MASFNKVLLIGNLTRDPQLSYLPSQTAVVDFGLAVNRRWKGQDGENKEETCFVDCRAFGRPAETINKYLSKGRQVFVEGRLTFDQWTSQDGTKRSRHRVTVENFQFLGGPPAGAQIEGAPNAKENVYEEGHFSDSGKAGPEADRQSEDDIPF
jgi:single-strand DNA-binding protein